jgi:hypothetical protein
MCEQVVAAEDSVIPVAPYVAHQTIAGILLKVVKLITVLVRCGHHVHDALVCPVCELIDMKSDFALEFVVTAYHSLVEVNLALIVVVYCDAVAGILCKEILTGNG